MEKKETTQVGCQSCKSSKGVLRTQRLVFTLGTIISLLSVYGAIRLFQDISSLF